MDRVILTASEGMILTNGEIWALRIELGDWDDAENYHEVPISEYNKINEE